LRPRDLVDRRTWHSIWNLPDDVAIQTTDHFGSPLRLISALCRSWTGMYGPLGLYDSGTRAPLGFAVLNAFDAFESSVLNAVVGYYRLAFIALRSVIEHMCVALELELARDRSAFLAWQRGEERSFGWAADLLPKHVAVQQLEAALRIRVGNDLFRQQQRQPPRRAGYARMLFGHLSRFVHAHPGFTDADLWQSNGPIFSAPTFLRWASAIFASYALSLVILKLGTPTLRVVDGPDARTVRELFGTAVEALPKRAALKRVLLAVPLQFW